VIIAQDAALDCLAVSAKSVGQAKWARRAMWVQNINWSDTQKSRINRFPISGDGTLCGPNLKESMEQYQLSLKTLKHTEDFQGSTQKQSYKRKGSNFGGNSGAKRQKSNYQGKPGYKGSYQKNKFQSQRGNTGNFGSKSGDTGKQQSG